MTIIAIKQKSFRNTGLYLIGALATGIALWAGINSQKQASFDVINGEVQESVVLKLKTEGIRVSDALRQELNQQHDELFKEVQKAFNLPEGEWEKALQKLEYLKANDDLLLPETATNKKRVFSGHPVEVKAKELLLEYGINPDRVTVYATFESKMFNNAAAEQGFAHDVIHQLNINLARITKLTPEVQEAILRHEIMHILNYDALEHAVILQMLENNNISAAEYNANPAMAAYFKQQEHRADLLAITGDIALAHTFKEYFDDYAEQFPQVQTEHACSSHPTDVQRSKAIERLIGCLEKEETIVVA